LTQCKTRLEAPGRVWGGYINIRALPELQHVEIDFLTPDGAVVAIALTGISLSDIQHQIEKAMHELPEIVEWQPNRERH
jgi:predicted SpoU family rRNA methylase